MIICYYRCACMDAERSVLVRARADGEDIVVWMETAQEAIGADHATVSPDCRRTTMEYAKIPIEDQMPIGATRAPPRKH